MRKWDDGRRTSSSRLTIAIADEGIRKSHCVIRRAVTAVDRSLTSAWISDKRTIRFISRDKADTQREREGEGKKEKQRSRKFHYLSKGPRDVSGANGGNLSLPELIKKRKAEEETQAGDVEMRARARTTDSSAVIEFFSLAGKITRNFQRASSETRPVGGSSSLCALDVNKRRKKKREKRSKKERKKKV